MIDVSRFDTSCDTGRKTGGVQAATGQLPVAKPPLLR